MRHNLEASHGLVFGNAFSSPSSRQACRGTPPTGSSSETRSPPGTRRDFAELVAVDPDITMRLDADALARAFDLGDALRHVDVIFERLGILAERLARKEEAVHA